MRSTLRTISGPGGASRKRAVGADDLEEVSPEQALKDGINCAGRAGGAGQLRWRTAEKRPSSGKKSPPSPLPHSALPSKPPPHALNSFLAVLPMHLLRGTEPLSNPGVHLLLPASATLLGAPRKILYLPRLSPSLFSAGTQSFPQSPSLSPFPSVAASDLTCARCSPQPLPSARLPLTLDCANAWPAVSPPLIPPQPPPGGTSLPSLERRQRERQNHLLTQPGRCKTRIREEVR